MVLTLGCVLVALAACLPAVLVWRALRHVAGAKSKHVIYSACLGALLAPVCILAEGWFWTWTGLGEVANDSGPMVALLATLLFATPVEEGTKLLVVWPLYSFRVLASRATGLVVACAAGSGFAAGEVLSLLAETQPDGIALMRVGVAALAHPFFAAAWGYALGSGSRVRWFSSVWMAATVFHGLFDHIVFGRGAGMVGAAVPLVGAMVVAAYFIVRAVARAGYDDSSTVEDAIPASLGEIGIALRAPKEPASILWGLVGGLVTTGVMLAFIAAGVYVGHRVGIDFASASEEDVRSNGPIVLLGVSALSAFPFAGYVVAKASAARSVLEPALGAAIAIAAAITGLYMAAPIAVVFAIAAAPVAFFLACAGAWFALGR